MEPTRRVLAIHFTKPSNSEANVVSNLLWHLDAGIGVKLLVNRAGNDDRASHLARLPVANSISLQGLDVGLPIDPQKPRSFAARVWSRLEHVARRGAAVRAAEAYRPDVVYTSQQRYDCRVGELISRRLGVPHIVHLHYTPGPWLGERALA
ncbi:MAG TPA: hypothetical protein VJT73_05740, partial [Polyangiaceae bacterium]|nr:hypothetical protein [Polyangiaceae bacterium]